MIQFKLDLWKEKVSKVDCIIFGFLSNPFTLRRLNNDGIVKTGDYSKISTYDPKIVGMLPSSWGSQEIYPYLNVSSY